MTCKRIISITFCTVVAGSVGSAAAQSASHSEPTPHNSTGMSELSDAASLSTAEQKEAAEALVRQLQERFDRPLSELIPAGQVLANTVGAALEFNPAIERLKGQERRLTMWRTHYRKAAESCKQEREGVRKKLDLAMAEVQAQVGDESTREQELVSVIQLYRPTLLNLKHAEDDNRSRIGRIDQSLEHVRRRLRDLNRHLSALDSRPAAIQGSDALQVSSQIIAVMTDAGDWERPLPADGTADAAESLASALESIEGL